MRFEKATRPATPQPINMNYDIKYRLDRDTETNDD
jgi:hypothetical protein